MMGVKVWIEGDAIAPAKRGRVAGIDL